MWMCVRKIVCVRARELNFRRQLLTEEFFFHTWTCLTTAGFAGALVNNYLDSDDNSLYALSDLWFINLDQLDSDGDGLSCLQKGICLRPIKWVEIQVPGARPLSRFGAGMSILDAAGQGVLYLSGGVHKVSSGGVGTSASMFELNDLLLFQLRDPFFARCSATGKGLASAVSGQQTPFFVACTDLLGAPANGAQFAVSITPGASCTDCPSTFPPVLNIANGLYRCFFTPSTAGEYQISILVGRGGKAFQEPVGGNPNAPTSTVDDVIRDQLASNPLKGFFELLVLAAPTNQVSSVAFGQGLTLSTSGTASKFFLEALDSFGNRRPGAKLFTHIPRCVQYVYTCIHILVCRVIGTSW